ncbi:hypothetical protein FisN_28Lu122 [Fistulifera solaris]|uniref:Uncharacterized protein n=1 Tax=Fistulifera solaris TaxID=1519565 RepID=A0A1Z5K587_FISSO|nr:hypothetical protein FisN_28Lu122 [Fistulifera solaris]|eukprot:GAX21397.1 hypothetical protein FisN_28Lu122 [Fistulifera solaris]
MKDSDQRFLYLQGRWSSTGSWVEAAWSKYNWIVLMGQRETGKSSPATKQFLELLFPEYIDDNTKEL